MYFWARAEILFGICEEVVGAGTDDEGAADFRVGDGELGVSGGGTGAHELLWEASATLFEMECNV